MAVGLVSDITKMIKDEQAKQAGVKKWEDIILNPYQALAEAESEAVSTQTKYDISDAYANYKRAELGVMRNQNLGSGFKRQIASALQSEYEKQYETEKAEEFSNIYNIGSKYSQEAQKQIAAQEKTLTEQASKLKKLEDYLIEYSGVDFSKATTPIEQGGLGYYAPVEGGAPGEFEMTDVGRDFFDKTMHTHNAENQLFSDYLLETDPELYEYYGQNKAAFNKYIAGLDETDITYTNEDRRALWGNNSSLVKDYIAEKDYYNQVMSAVDITKDDFTFWDGTVGTYSGENKFGRREVYDKFTEIANDLNVSDIYSDKVIKQKLNAIVNKIKSTPAYNAVFWQNKKKISVGEAAVQELLNEMAEASAKKYKK